MPPQWLENWRNGPRPGSGRNWRDGSPVDHADQNRFGQAPETVEPPRLVSDKQCCAFQGHSQPGRLRPSRGRSRPSRPAQQLTPLRALSNAARQPWPSPAEPRCTRGVIALPVCSGRSMARFCCLQREFVLPATARPTPRRLRVFALEQEPHGVFRDALCHICKLMITLGFN